jgi:hypothetical protein
VSSSVDSFPAVFLTGPPDRVVDLMVRRFACRALSKVDFRSAGGSFRMSAAGEPNDRPPILAHFEAECFPGIPLLPNGSSRVRSEIFREIRGAEEIRSQRCILSGK